MASTAQILGRVQSDDRSVKRRAACDECRAKKLKCSGHQPSCLRCERESIPCVYSAQKQMGRPKKRPTTTDQSLNTIAKKARPSATTLLNSEPSKDADAFDLAQFQDALTPGGNLQPWLQNDWASTNDAIIVEPSDQSAVPGLTPDTTSSQSNSPPTLNLPPELRSSSFGHDHTVSNHGDAGTSLLLDPALAGIDPSAQMPPGLMPNCACLSTLYLTLSSLQGMDNDFNFPFSLHPLREAMSTASAVLKCEECPTRFITAIQNTQLVGTLLMSIAERFSKVLEYITAEADRAAAAGETKKFRLADLNTSTSHLHTNGLGCVAAFSINLSPEEWKSMCKKVIRAEVYGPADGEHQCCACFTGICTQMIERQERWHRSPVPNDFPKDQTGAPIGGPRNMAGPGHGQGEHLCLKLVKYAHSLIENFDWS